MGLFVAEMERINISGEKTEAVKSFLEEWMSCEPFIKAHTSGTTGTPKEIKLLKEDMITSARRTLSFFSLDERSILALPLSADYIAGKMMIVRALEGKCRLWTEAPSRQILSEFPYNEINLLAIVPAQVESMIKAITRIKIHNVIIGGAPLSEELEELLIRTGVNAYATYGMTETCSHVALRSLGSNIYKALPGVKFSADKDNCLIIRQSDMSVSTVKTNDIVRLVSDDRFEWLGRKDNIINSGGVKLFPESIERKISHLINRPFYVTSRCSSVWGEELVLVIEGSANDKLELNEINAMLGKYEHLKSIIFESKLDRTVSGKLIRKKY